MANMATMEEETKAEKKRVQLEKSKKTKKGFDAVAKKSVLDPEFEELGQKLVERVQDVLTKCGATLSEVNGSDTKLRALFASAIETLESRVKILRMASGEPEDAAADKHFGHEAAWDTFRQTPEVKDPWDQHRAPYDLLMEMPCLPKVVFEMKSYEVASDEDVKSEKKND